MLQKAFIMAYNEEVIISDTAFDMPADNYEEIDQELDSEKLGSLLVQNNTLKGTTREYQFYADDHLLVNMYTKRKAAGKKFLINLAWLSSEPLHSRIIVWKWLHYALISGLFMAVFVFLTVKETIRFEYGMVAVFILITSALIFSLIFIYNLQDEYIFKSRFGDARLFSIENKRPKQSTFDNFFINLQQRIDKSQGKLSVTERLVGELKMCRRLRDEGIIDDETYTLARTAIFKHEQYKV